MAAADCLPGAIGIADVRGPDPRPYGRIARHGGRLAATAAGVTGAHGVTGVTGVTGAHGHTSTVGGRGRRRAQRGTERGAERTVPGRHAIGGYNPIAHTGAHAHTGDHTGAHTGAHIDAAAHTGANAGAHAEANAGTRAEAGTHGATSADPDPSTDVPAGHASPSGSDDQAGPDPTPDPNPDRRTDGLASTKLNARAVGGSDTDTDALHHWAGARHHPSALRELISPASAAEDGRRRPRGRQARLDAGSRPAPRRGQVRL